MMNDSGYGSPMKNNELEEITFTLEQAGSKPKNGPDEIVAAKHETLEQAIVRRFSEMNVQQRIFWAKLRDHNELASVNPFTCLCGNIQHESIVEWTHRDEIIYINNVNLEKPTTSSVFYIECCKRRALPQITNIHYKIFREKDLCVASGGQSIKEALENDGRFKNVDQFKLHHGPKRKSPSHSAMASSFPNVIFTVDVRKIKSDVSKPHSAMAGEKSSPTELKADKAVAVPKSERSSADGGSSCVDERQEEGKEPSPPNDTLDEMRELFVFSKPLEELSNNEMFHEMEERMVCHARTVLVPKDQQHQYRKFISDLAHTQFAMQHSLARPARLTKDLAPLVDSIGRIWCGDVSATCFLLSQNHVITNYHVLKMIFDCSRSSNHAAYGKIFVDFNYEEPGQCPETTSVCITTPASRLLSTRFFDAKLDYAILELEQSVSDKDVLGPYVRCSVPECGLVTIIGHPGKREKLEETARILPEAARNREISKRVEEKEKRCASHPSECGLNQINDDSIKCIHMCKVNIGSNVMTYDVASMFEGSSGSPVFNMSGEIVALHSAGYRLNETSKKTSLIELGVTFKSIIKDMRDKGYDKSVQNLFPNCDGEDMDTDCM